MRIFLPRRPCGISTTRSGYIKWLATFATPRRLEEAEDRRSLRELGAEEPDWNVAVIIFPWNVYLYTGDRTILADSYEAMNEEWMAYLVKENPDYISKHGVGDWVSPFKNTVLMR